MCVFTRRVYTKIVCVCVCLKYIDLYIECRPVNVLCAKICVFVCLSFSMQLLLVLSACYTRICHLPHVILFTECQQLRRVYKYVACVLILTNHHHHHLLRFALYICVVSRALYMKCDGILKRIIHHRAYFYRKL